ncbi:MAG: hypothetical protein ACREO3_11340 [Arenimonas sp.]
MSDARATGIESGHCGLRDGFALPLPLPLPLPGVMLTYAGLLDVPSIGA